MDNGKRNNKLLNIIIKGSGHTQKSIAENLGINPVTVSYWCSGKAWPTRKNLSKLSRILKVDESILKGEEPLPFPDSYEAFIEHARRLNISYGDLLLSLTSDRGE